MLENASFVPNTPYMVTVGAGGRGGYPTTTTTGGTSSFLGVSAQGGGKGGNTANDGKGNGNGGYATSNWNYSVVNATPGTIPGYSSFTETVIYGGGGSGGFAW